MYKPGQSALWKLVEFRLAFPELASLILVTLLIILENIDFEPDYLLWYSEINGIRLMTIHKGSCHCGRVKYEVEAPEELDVSECNCSICSKSGYLHLTVPRSRFHLLSGEDNLETYTFDTHEAKHLFCKTCGIKSYYIPRSHPDGISVNVRCLEPATIRSINIEPFDGMNWEENIHKLKPLDNE